MKNWIIPVGLIALSTVPLIGGAARLNDLSNGSITPENARFFSTKWPVVLGFYFQAFNQNYIGQCLWHLVGP